MTLENHIPSCDRNRLERVLGRVLRIEAERGATFEELLECSPLLARRLLEGVLARRDLARAAPAGAPMPEWKRALSRRGRKRVSRDPLQSPALASG